MNAYQKDQIRRAISILQKVLLVNVSEPPRAKTLAARKTQLALDLEAAERGDIDAYENFRRLGKMLRELQALEDRPIKKKIGRPLGSKNKPKVTHE